MNLLQLSQTLNDTDDHDCMSMLHTGTAVSDVNLSILSTGYIPPKNADVIDKLITELNTNIRERDAILTKLISTVLSSFHPVTFADYLWYFQFTVTILLLKGGSTLPALQGHLLTMCFSPPTTVWDSNPIKMDYFASNLYPLMEDDKDLIFVTNQIENRSSFGFYLSMCMLWKSIYRCIGEDKTTFRLYPPFNLVDVTKKIASKKLDTECESIFRFILLHSKMSSLIFHRKLRTPHYKCYEEFFVYDSSLIQILKQFLEDTMAKAEALWRRDNENVNYLTMVEYLQIDISEFDTLIKKHQT